MRSLLIALAFVTLGLNSFAQAQCDFLKSLNFKNGRDTVVVKAILGGISMAPPPIISKNSHRPSIYKFKSYVDITFQPEGCNKEYTVPLLDHASDDHTVDDAANIGITATITLLVFNEYRSKNGDPDFLVIKVTPAIQTSIIPLNKCNFLPDLHFKNGTDTIVIKANYHDHFKPGIGLILTDLDKKRVLNAKDYEKGIAFQVTGCDEKIIAPYHFKTTAEEELLYKQPEDSTIYLTCVVFQNYYSYGMPFFVIEKFKLDN